MRIHIAARREQRRRARFVADGLEDSGHKVVSRWIRGTTGRTPAEDEARFTITDLTVADCVVFIAESAWEHKLVPGASERHVEFGYALRAGKRLCVLGPRETNFCHLPQIERFRTLKELVDALR
ncbi:MAG: hypothetical protein SFX73_08480 [Kofleriaceae bacterium]|nr:hypothetical protein [Kofleriaceae bacterium]